MSHTSVYSSVKITNLNTLSAVANLTELGQLDIGKQTVRMFGHQSVEAVAKLEIKGWRYPLAIDKEGKLWYDNWGSEVGSMDNLGRLLQAYSKAVVVAEANQNPDVYSYWVNDLDNGDVEVILDYAD